VRRALAALLLVAATGCAGGSDETKLSLPPGELFAVSSSVTPQKSLFGDPVTVRLRILFDRSRVAPEAVETQYGFRPFRDRTTVERVDSGSLTALLYTIELQCLTLACVPPEGDFTSSWGARITTGIGPVQDIRFPGITVASRIPPESEFPPENTGEEAQDWPPRWRATVSLPEPSYRLSPRLMTWLLAGLGALLVGASSAAGLLLLRRGRLVRDREIAPLDRALDLLRRARTDEERRAALEALALALDAERGPELAQPARALAWSESRPSETAAEELADLARGTVR
jgi:hypothetical protein